MKIVKPTLPTNHTSKDAYEYAGKLKAYEQHIAHYSRLEKGLAEKEAIARLNKTRTIWDEIDDRYKEWCEELKTSPEIISSYEGWIGKKKPDEVKEVIQKLKDNYHYLVGYENIRKRYNI